ncbi:MAG: hypothetical protein AAGJ35_12515, partial [Myxococcota bacterium]
LDKGLEAFGEQQLSESTKFEFKTAQKPTLKLEGKYVWTLQFPAPDFQNKKFDTSKTFPVEIPIEIVSTPAGGKAVMRLQDDLQVEYAFVLNGKRLITGSLPTFAGNTLAETTGINADVSDKDQDGVADFAEGTLVLSGPGFETKGVKWTLAIPAQKATCQPSSKGQPPISVKQDKDQIIIDWGSENALGLYVTAPDARIPQGPGTVQGKAYWVLSAASFQQGFSGPVVYGTTPNGAKDDSAANNVPAGGEPLRKGTCYKFSVITQSFQIKETVLSW